MESCIQRINNQINYLDKSFGTENGYKLSDLMNGMKNEQTEIWVAASIKLGELMPENPQAREYIFEQLLNKSDIHAVRHAFTAFFIYTARIKQEGLKNSISLLNNYENLNKADVIKQDANDFVLNILRYFEDKGKASLSFFWGDEKLNDKKMSFINPLFPGGFQAIIDDKIKKETEIIQSLPEAIQAIKLEKTINPLKSIDLQTITINEFGRQAGFGFKKPSPLLINDWIISSIQYSVEALADAYREEIDFFWVICGFLSFGETQTGMFKNIPFMLTKLTEANITDTNKLKEITLNLIMEGRLHVDPLHYLDFLCDFNDCLRDDNIGFIDMVKPILPPEMIPDLESPHIGDKIAGLFDDELKWKQRGKQYVYLMIVFGYTIYDGLENKNKKALADRIAKIYKEISRLLVVNNALVQMLLRILKELFFREREINRRDYLSGKIELEKYYRVCEKQILMSLPILHRRDWGGVIEKDTATILINCIEEYHELSEGRELTLKGESFSYEISSQRLMYYVFLNLPTPKVLKEMVSYCQSRDEGSVFRLYLEHFINPSEKEIVSPFGDYLRYFQFRDIRHFRNCYRENPALKKVFKWKIFSDSILNDTNWYFFYRYLDNSRFLDDLEQKSDSESEISYNNLNHLLRECSSLLEEIHLIQKENETGYTIDTEELSFDTFLLLPDKLQRLLNHLGMFENFIIDNFPIYEKNITLARDTETEKTYGINQLQKDCSTEREVALRLRDKFDFEDEDGLADMLSQNDNKLSEVGEKYFEFIKQWFISRYAYTRLLKPKTRRKKPNPLLWLKGTDNLFLRAIFNKYIVIGMLFIPFILRFAEVKLFGLSQFSPVYSVTAFYLFPAFLLWGSISILKDSLKKRKSKAFLGYGHFLMPKMIAMNLIAFVSMYLTDEIWTLYFAIKPIAVVLMVILFMLASYLIIGQSVFNKIKLSGKARFERISQIMSLGLFQSLLINFYFAMSFSHIMTGKARGDFQNLRDILSYIHIGEFQTETLLSPYLWDSSRWQLGMSFAYTLHPHMVLVWTAQTFCFGVIIQLFLGTYKLN